MFVSHKPVSFLAKDPFWFGVLLLSLMFIAVVTVLLKAYSLSLCASPWFFHILVVVVFVFINLVIFYELSCGMGKFRVKEEREWKAYNKVFGTPKCPDPYVDP